MLSFFLPFPSVHNFEHVRCPEAVGPATDNLAFEKAHLTSTSAILLCEQASHVAMSVSKLLLRIVAPQLNKDDCPDAARQEQYLHDHTCGITSDPLTQFSVILSALIHDLDHPGVSNGQLIKEESKLASLYKGRSVAEQNSVDLAWDILMQKKFAALRNAIFCSEPELRRFRQLLVNSVIATDIFDKDLGALRRNRWEKAFDKSEQNNGSRGSRGSRADSNRKASIVIEHLIQASDVAHTMQHVSRSNLVRRVL